MTNNNAGGMISSMINRTAEKLSSLIPSLSSASEAVDLIEDLKRLEVTMKRLHPIAVVLEQRGVMDIFDRFHLEELKNVVYDADDVVDEYEFEVLSAKIRDGIQLGGNDYKHKHQKEVSQITTSQSVQRELAIKVKEITWRVDRSVDLKWIEDEVRKEYAADRFKPPRSSFFSVAPVYGRDEDKEKIVKLLISDDSSCSGVGSLVVLPLVGMGGIGKTALAQLVYSDERVCEYFQLRAWVCASEDFFVESLTRDIIASLTNRTCDIMGLNDLQITLADEVKGKKILLVLDDVWNEQPSLWHLLTAPLTRTCFCKIIVTTRSQNVARKIQTMPSYVLTLLPFKYCWSLFKQHAIRCQDPNLNPRLLEIGEKIVEKCKGLPLAVKALGSIILLFEDDEEYWREILDSEIWESELRNTDVLCALKISYDYLPLHLKLCFVVLSLFPKNYIIPEDQIVRLWMSLGLVLPEGRKSLEEIGIGYLTEFMQRSMLQLTPQTSNHHSLTNKKERCFIMHDLINDLARSVSGKDFSIIDPRMLNELPYNARYISIVCNEPTYSVDLQNLHHLKAPRLLQVLDVMKFQGSKPNHFNVKINIPEELFSYLTHLRCLIFRDILIEALPESVGNLKLLRYLDLANTGIESLPDSICNLYNLQILDLTNCPIEELPSGISNLVSLQQLIFQQSLSMCMPCGVGKLTKLRTPSWFHVNKGIWLCELKDLVRHKEELHITGLNNVANIKQADDANLENETRLNVLILDWSRGPTCSHYAEIKGTSHDWSSKQGLVEKSEFHAELLERLQPHKKLKELHIREYCGSRFPSWLGDSSFYLLAEISIKSVKGNCSSLPSLGQLPSLKNLTIESMEGVREVRREFCASLYGDKNGFRSLETLSFSDMKNWNYWFGVWSDEFRTLQTLRIVDCPKLRRLPNPLSSSLTKLVIKDCDELSDIPTLRALSFLILTGQIREGIFDSLCLPRLKALQVSDSRNVRTLDLDCMKFPILEVLVVHGCRNLQYIAGIDGLRSLKTIKISACQIIKFTLYQKFPSTLERLDIKRCPQLSKWKEIQEFTYYDQLYKNYNVSHEIIQELEVIESDTEDDDSE